MLKIIYLLSTFFIITACSLNTLVVRNMVPVLEKSAEALYEESDLILAEQALASNLKLLEGLLKNDPQNRNLLLLCAQGYAGYALGFAEDESVERARDFYLRARDFGMRSLGKKALESDWAAFLQDQEAEEVPALFWTAFAWSGFIQISMDDPAALLDLPIVEQMMQRVLELDEDYYYGAVHLFFGAYYGMKPRMMGGDPEKAAQYFRKNIDLNQGKFLLAYVYAARFHAAMILDEALFDQYLNQVEEPAIDLPAELNLLNAVARKKARLLRAEQDELF